MRPASLQPLSVAHGAPDRHRAASMALVVILHVLLLLLLLRLAPPPERISTVPMGPIIVALSPEAEVTPSRSQAAAPPSARQREEPPDRMPPRRAVRPDAEEAPVSSIWSQVIPMTRQQMAEADIGRFPPRAAAPAAGAGESGDAPGRDTDDTSGPGKGPNGETLYNARWYREPTHAELSTYMPAGRRPEGWGIIACRTMPNYRVDNCEEIAQSPAGSGLAGAVRKAAWQFRIMPPRIGGRQMVGAWVRIRIDYHVSGPE